MEKRNTEWEAKKQKFIGARMDELKTEILEHAGSELFKENNKKIVAQREAERKARDEAIKQKRMQDGTADEVDRAVGITGPGAADKAEAGGWTRNTQKAEAASPEKPRRQFKAEETDTGFVRSAKPRANEEESKGDNGFKKPAPREEGAFTRGPPRNEPKGDSGFPRGA